MSKHVRQRFLSLTLTALLCGISIMRNSEVAFSAGETLDGKAEPSAATPPHSAPMRRPQTSLAAALKLHENELLPQREVEPYQANPVADAEVKGGSFTRSTNVPDIHGTLSVENFGGQLGNLSWTHDSADGFRNYLAGFYAPNFAYQDAGVGVWQYHDVAGGDNFDLWSSGGTDLGIDAARAVWHSGHGGMGADGTFFAPVGFDWAGRGWTAVSTNMALGGNNNAFGNERLRYIFWDTCDSLKVEGEHNPIRTWGARARGIRMIFGYNTVSVDDPNYGKFFWEEWNKGKTLTRAFLDASWRINTHQSPAVVACGATQSDAINRRDTERLMFADAVNCGWMYWHWFTAASFAPDKGAAGLSVPSQVTAHQVEAKTNADAEVVAIAQALGINLGDTSLIQSRPLGSKVVKTPALTLVVEPDGDYEISIEKAAAQDDAALAAPAVEMADARLIGAAKKLVQELQLAGGKEYEIGLIRYLNESNGSVDSPQLTAPTVSEKTIVFDQVINGLRFIDPDAGHIEVTFDARSGEVRRIRGTTRAIVPASKSGTTSGKAMSIEQARAQALKAGAGLEMIADSESTGYHMLDGKATPVYRVLLSNPNYPGSRPQQVLIPLLQSQ